MHNATAETKETEFVRFVREFGTHYARQTGMGAQLIYIRRFASKHQTTEEHKDRKKCVKSEAKFSASGGYGQFFHINGSFKQKDKDCTESSDDERFEESETAELTKTISLGSRPKDLSKWIDAEFTPVPISRVLENITDLFRKEWLEVDEDYGFSETLNESKIKEIFDEYIQQYCRLFFSDYFYDDCTPKITGNIFITPNLENILFAT